MPATITKTSKTTTKKAATPSTKAVAAAAPAPKKEKFVVPPKPTTEPTGINRDDYGYIKPSGKFKFWQGYDAKFKKNLMNLSRALPESDLSKQARQILVDAGWSTMDREEAMVILEKQKTARAVERIKAKAEKPKAKKEAPAKADEQEDLPEAA